MIKLSTRSRYGLRILLHIAQDSRQGRLSSGRGIAEAQELTGPYLEQIMITLKAEGLVKARRGCRGGYELSCQPEQISVLNIIEIFEGKVQLVNCDNQKKLCHRREHCPTYPVWKKLSDGLRESAQAITLASLMSQEA